MLAPDQLTLVLRHLTPARRIDGCAALLLPYDEDGRPDLDALADLVQRTYAAGLTPAINTTAGYADLLTDDERDDALTVTAGVARGRRFLAAVLPESSAAPLAVRYARAMARVRRQGGTPMMWPCSALTTLDDDAVADAYQEATVDQPGALAVEIAPALDDGSRVYSLDLFQRLTDIPTLGGVFHVSHSRVPEWYRLEARDTRRPEFRVYSGHELAIDMPAYGSDYVLASAGVLPEAFRMRDRLWTSGDAQVTELNDALQFVSAVIHRAPIAAARHSAAHVLAMRGALSGAWPHPGSARRPDAELDLLRGALERLDALLQRVSVEPPFPLSASRR